MSTAVIAYAVLKAGVNDWIALVVFGFFTFGAISRSVNLSKAMSAVKSNPTPDQCAETAEEVYKLDYATYYDGRQEKSYEGMLPKRPRHYRDFQIFSIIIAGICSLLGLIYIVAGIFEMILSTTLAREALAGMIFLYGSLAAYFGIKDFISILASFKAKPVN